MSARAILQAAWWGRDAPWRDREGAPKEGGDGEGAGFFTARGLFGLVLLLTPIATWLWFLHRRVFRSYGKPSPLRGPTGNLLILCPPGTRSTLPRSSSLKRQSLNLRTANTSELKTILQTGFSSRRLVLEEFEARFANRQARLDLLEWLEKLVAKHRRGVVLVSTLHPLEYLAPGAAGGSERQRARTADSEEIARWRILLGRFSPYRVKGEIRRSREAFASIWDRCSRAEQSYLARLAHDGMANPKETDTVRQLLDAGLLRLSPIGLPEIYGAEFAGFVRETAPAEAPYPGPPLEAASRGIPMWIIAALVAGVIFFVFQDVAMSAVGALISVVTAMDKAGLWALLRPGSGGPKAA